LLEVQTSSGWNELGIGDKIDVGSKVKISEEGTAEFLIGTTTITISEDGTYSLSELVGKSRQVASWNLGSLVSDKLKKGLSGSQGKDAAAMGVRATGVEREADIEWLGEEGNEDILLEGIEYLEAERYEDALEAFRDGLALSFEDERQRFLYYIGYTQALQGNAAEALTTFTEVDLDPQSEYYAEYLLLKGRLMIESFAFNRALSMFHYHLNLFPEGALSQAVMVLASYCHIGQGEPDKAEEILSKAVDLDPDSDIGLEAERLLQNL
jgi:tetratricopeptide (TPR) repeat protein